MTTYVAREQIGTCRGCGNEDDLRMGFCFDCAAAGERRAAHRTVIQHLGRCLFHLKGGWKTEARIDFMWAWERLTRTGDYAPRGAFDREYFHKPE